MNCYLCSVSDENGHVSEIYLWASNFMNAEKLAIYEWITDYFVNDGIDDIYFYSTVEHRRVKNKHEFILSLHNDISDLHECKVFLVEVKKCRNKKLYEDMSYS